MKKKEHAPDTPLTAEEERAQAENPALEKEEIPPQEEADTQEEKEADVDQWREALEQAVKQRDDYLDSLRPHAGGFPEFPPPQPNRPLGRGSRKARERSFRKSFRQLTISSARFRPRRTIPRSRRASR